MLLLILAEGAIQLVPDGTIFIHIALILLMVGILNRTLFRPVGEVLDRRDKESRGQLDEAGEVERQVSSRRRERREALRAARASGYALVEEKRSEALREHEREIAEVGDRVNELTEQQLAIIEEEASNARNAMDPGSLATMIRDQVLKPIRNQGRAD